MSESLRARLRAELRPWLGDTRLASPRDLSQADLVAFAPGPAGNPPAFRWVEVFRQGQLWNFRWTPLALHWLLLSWEPPQPQPVPPPQLQAGGNLGAARAWLLAGCLARLGRSQPLPLASASGPYLDPWQLLATPPGQGVQGVRLSDGHPLERALGRMGRLRGEFPSPPLQAMEGLTPPERELLVRLEQLEATVAVGLPHRLAAWAQDLARRMDALYATTPLLERGLALAVWRTAGRGLQAAADLLGLNQEGVSLCL